MTALNQSSNSPVLVDSTDQDQKTPVLTSRKFQRGALPAPKGKASSVADSGRIQFGMGFRLPTAK
jgi:hypothetical protein